MKWAPKFELSGRIAGGPGDIESVGIGADERPIAVHQGSPERYWRSAAAAELREP